MEQRRVMMLNNYLKDFDKIICDMKTKMLSIRTSGNITIDFINSMIPYYENIIKMYENLNKYINHQSLLKIVNSDMQIQKEQIKQMEEIQKTTPRVYNIQNSINLYMKAYYDITNNIVYKISNSYRYNNISLNFINKTTQYFEGGIELCNNVLKYNIDKRLVILTQNIINQKMKTIKELNKIKNYIGY